MTRQSIEKAVREAISTVEQNKEGGYGTAFGKDQLKPKQIDNLRKGFAKGCNPEEIVIFCDSTLMNSGKAGMLFLTQGFYGSELNFLEKKNPIPQPILYEDLAEVTKADKNHFFLRYKDGAQRQAYGGYFNTFIIEAFRNILALLPTGGDQKEDRGNSLGKRPEESAGRPVEETVEKAVEEIPEETVEKPVGEIPKETVERPAAEGPEKPLEEPAASGESLPAEVESNIITLKDTDGNGVSFEFLDLITYRGKDYVVLLPLQVEEEEDEGMVIILQVEESENGEEENYLAVEDETTMTAVFAIFQDRFQKEFQFTEEAEIISGGGDGHAPAVPVPYTGAEPYIFISYSHRDSKEVWKIIARLQADGYRVWYDEGIDPGSEWDDNIATHIENCGCLMAFISNNYLNSENCRDELNYARDLGVGRLLVYIEDVALQGGMAMRMNRLQALYYCRYQIKELFYRRLYESGVMNAVDLKEKK